VAHLGAQTRQRVEQRCLAAIRIARQNHIGWPGRLGGGLALFWNCGGAHVFEIQSILISRSCAERAAVCEKQSPNCEATDEAPNSKLTSTREAPKFKIQTRSCAILKFGA